MLSVRAIDRLCDQLNDKDWHITLISSCEEIKLNFLLPIVNCILKWEVMCQ